MTPSLRSTIFLCNGSLLTLLFIPYWCRFYGFLFRKSQKNVIFLVVCTIFDQSNFQVNFVSGHSKTAAVIFPAYQGGHQNWSDSRGKRNKWLLFAFQPGPDWFQDSCATESPLLSQATHLTWLVTLGACSLMDSIPYLHFIISFLFHSHITHIHFHVLYSDSSTRVPRINV